MSVGAKVLSVKCVAAVDFSSVTGNSVVAVSVLLASIVFIAGDAVSNGLFVTKLGLNVGTFVETTIGRAVGVRSDTGCGASVPVLLRFGVSLGIGVIVVVGNDVEGSVGQLVTVVGGNEEMGLVRNGVIFVVIVDITVVETIKTKCESVRKNKLPESTVSIIEHRAYMHMCTRKTVHIQVSSSNVVKHRYLNSQRYKHFASLV